MLYTACSPIIGPRAISRYFVCYVYHYRALATGFTLRSNSRDGHGWFYVEEQNVPSHFQNTGPQGSYDEPPDLTME